MSAPQLCPTKESDSTPQCNFAEVSEQEKELAAIVVAGPDPEQDGFSAYTLDDLCTLAKDRFDVDYGPTGMSNVVKRLGFSRQKARPHHPKKDEAAQAAFKGAP